MTVLFIYLLFQFALSKASLATDGGGEMGVGLALYKSERVFVKKLLSQNSTVGNNQRLAKDLLMDLRKVSLILYLQ